MTILAKTGSYRIASHHYSIAFESNVFPYSCNHKEKHAINLHFDISIHKLETGEWDGFLQLFYTSSKFEVKRMRMTFTLQRNLSWSHCECVWVCCGECEADKPKKCVFWRVYELWVPTNYGQSLHRSTTNGKLITNSVRAYYFNFSVIYKSTDPPVFRMHTHTYTMVWS